MARLLLRVHLGLGVADGSKKVWSLPGGRRPRALAGERSPPAHQCISKHTSTRPATLRKGLIGMAEGRRRVLQVLLKHRPPGGRGGVAPWLQKFLARSWLRYFYSPF